MSFPENISRLAATQSGENQSRTRLPWTTAESAVEVMLGGGGGTVWDGSTTVPSARAVLPLVASILTVDLPDNWGGATGVALNTIPGVPIFIPGMKNLTFAGTAGQCLFWF